LPQKQSRSPTLRSNAEPLAAHNSIAPLIRVPGRMQPNMHLWAMDVWVRDETILTDRARVRAIMYDAAEFGGVTVLGEEFCVFTNSAVTGVLVLAQSHLSIHTWPEFALANIDLLTYGSLRGEDVMDLIGRRLNADRVNVTCMRRAFG
jgi:S-adenosylmethionine decarboxylase